MKKPKSFSWKIVAEPKPVPGTIRCQEQCSSNTGQGNGQCGTGK